MDARRAALSEKKTVRDNIDLYQSNLQAADVLFEYLPKSTTEVRDKLMEAFAEFEEDNTYLIDEIAVSGYNVTVILQSLNQEVPTKYIRNLIEQDYFEAIEFSGFSGEEPEKDKEDETTETTTLGEAEEGVIFYNSEITMRIKGGNNVELK